MQYPTLDELISWGIETVSIHPAYAYPHDTTPSKYVVCGTGKGKDGSFLASQIRTMRLGTFPTLAEAHKAFPTAILLFNPPPIVDRAETDHLKRCEDLFKE